MSLCSVCCEVDIFYSCELQTHCETCPLGVDFAQWELAYTG